MIKWKLTADFCFAERNDVHGGEDLSAMPGKAHFVVRIAVEFRRFCVHCLEMCHFPQESVACGQASKNKNKAFSLAMYCPIFRT